jgi:Ca2+-binding RTX toxin-like protein
VPGEADNVGADIEDATGTAKADTITGSAAANELNGGSGNDSLNGGGGSDGLNGARGNDVLDGGPGIDALAGGPGNDTLRARDISADDVSCGGGVDSALLDASDVPRACEAVSRGVGVATTSARVVSGGVTLRLVCPAIEAVRCAGTLTLRNGVTRVGGRSFSIASGAAANIRVALNARGRRAKAVIATNIFRDAVGVGVITRKAVTLR